MSEWANSQSWQYSIRIFNNQCCGASAAQAGAGAEAKRFGQLQLQKIANLFFGLPNLFSFKLFMTEQENCQGEFFKAD